MANTRRSLQIGPLRMTKCLHSSRYTAFQRSSKELRSMGIRMQFSKFILNYQQNTVFVGIGQSKVHYFQRFIEIQQ